MSAEESGSRGATQSGSSAEADCGPLSTAALAEDVKVCHKFPSVPELLSPGIGALPSPHGVTDSLAGLPRWFSDKESVCSAGDAGDAGLFPGSERSPGDGKGNPLQYSCLENPMDRGARWATVHGAAKEWDTTEHAHIHATNSSVGPGKGLVSWQKQL